MGSVFHGYMCILLYVKLMWCSGFPEMYAEYGQYVCHRYMCIPSICKTYLVWSCCIDLWSIGGGGGVSLPWVYMLSTIYETLFGVVML